MSPPPEEQVQSLIGQGIALMDTLKILLPKANREELDAWATTYRKIYQDEGQTKIDLFDGVKEILEKFKASEIQTVVISNKSELAITATIEKFKLTEFIGEVVGDRDGMKGKPHPDVFNQLIQPTYSKIDKSDILMVGDTESDLLFAQAIHVDACWASYGYGQPEKCRRLNPKFAIDSLFNLWPLIARSANP